MLVRIVMFCGFHAVVLCTLCGDTASVIYVGTFALSHLPLPFPNAGSQTSFAAQRQKAAVNGTAPAVLEAVLSAQSQKSSSSGRSHSLHTFLVFGHWLALICNFKLDSEQIYSIDRQP